MIKLKELRLLNGLTQGKLADKIGVARSTIAMYETDSSEPDLQTLTKIARYFNVTTDYLLDREHIQTNDFGNFSKVLRDLRISRNLSQDRLAAILNIPTKMIISWENNENQPTINMLTKLANYFNVPFDAFMGKAIVANQSKGIKIPVLGVIPAGIPIEAVEDILDYEEISEDMASRGEYFALKVKGDSMHPIINDGDVVIVKQEDDADSGKICVVMINGFDATLKRIKKESNGIWILPENPYCDFKPTFYTNQQIIDTPIKIIGVAVEIRRSL